MNNAAAHLLAYSSTWLTRREALTFRDDALREWNLSGGIEEVQARVLLRLRAALNYACSCNSYYAALFRSAGVDARSISNLKDIAALPVTTKDDIRTHQAEFEACEALEPQRVRSATGGSTGQPLKFSMSRADYLRGIGVQLAGWSLAGYELGDRLAYLGGASIVKNDRSPWHPSTSDILLNRREFSALFMDDSRIAHYWSYVDQWKPLFFRGYPASLAEFCRQRQGGVASCFSPRAVLTTSETLTASDRHIIQETMKAPVFDAWGLNDGGASAYECPAHAGMHVDTTRAYVETVDDYGRPIWNEPGRIIVTSLTNKAFPFVRYDTGDIGVLAWRDCACGRSGLMLMQILGRADDRLTLGGLRTEAAAGSWLTDLNHLRRWRIVQDAPLHITASFDVDPEFDRQTSEDAFVRSFTTRCPSVSISFIYEPLPLPQDGSKWRSVVVLDEARRSGGMKGEK